MYLLDNIFIRFGTKLYRQTIDIPMGTYCAPLVGELFLFSYERDFIKSLSRENQAIIVAFNSKKVREKSRECHNHKPQPSTFRYLDELLDIDNIYFDKMVDRIYPK